MADLKKKVLHNNESIHFYKRYVDDIIILVRRENDIIQLQEKMEQNSVLRFTHEIGCDTLPCLDINILLQEKCFKTNVNIKATEIQGVSNLFIFN